MKAFGGHSTLPGRRGAALVYRPRPSRDCAAPSSAAQLHVTPPSAAQTLGTSRSDSAANVAKQRRSSARIVA